MKSFASFVADRSIREMESETPVPTGKQVLIRTTHSGVCHSDVHGRDGYVDLGSRGKLEFAAAANENGQVMGHEVVGEVVAVGPDVSDRQLGERVLVYPWIGCGECFACLDDAENACRTPRGIGTQQPGGYADHVLIPDEKYTLEIEGLDPAWAATLACSGVTSFSAVNKVLPLPSEEPVAVIGVGGVGQSAVTILSFMGHKNIIALDLSPANLELAANNGATQTLQIATDSTAKTIREELGIAPAAVIDFVNNTQTAAIGFDWLAKGGTMVQVGLFGGEMVVPTALLAMKMLTIRGSYVGNLKELRALIDIAKSGQLPPAAVHSGVLDAQGVLEALDALEERRVAGRVVLEAKI